MKIHQGFAHRVCSRQLVTEPSLIGEFSALPTGEDERTDRGGRGDDSNSLGEHGFLHPNRYTRQRACRIRASHADGWTQVAAQRWRATADEEGAGRRMSRTATVYRHPLPRAPDNLGGSLERQCPPLGDDQPRDSHVHGAPHCLLSQRRPENTREVAVAAVPQRSTATPSPQPAMCQLWTPPFRAQPPT